MADSAVHKKLEKIAQKLDFKGTLLRAWKLDGGVSAQVTALEILKAGGDKTRVVIRQHGEVDRARNPHIAAEEYQLLRILKSEGLPTPTPYLLDESCEIFARPYIVIEFIDGEPTLHPANVEDFIRQFATVLASIHNVDISRVNLSFLPKQEEIYATKLATRPTTLDESLEEGRIRYVLEPIWPLPCTNVNRLLHGDYWPGNTMWKDGRLTGVIDWEDAALGDPMADLANTRLEILWAFGVDAMVDFTRHYLSLMGSRIDTCYLPYWELCAALRPASKLSNWGLDETTEVTMRKRHKWFVHQAFENLIPINP